MITRLVRSTTIALVAEYCDRSLRSSDYNLLLLRGSMNVFRLRPISSNLLERHGGLLSSVAVPLRFHGGAIVRRFKVSAGIDAYSRKPRALRLNSQCSKDVHPRLVVLRRTLIGGLSLRLPHTITRGMMPLITGLCRVQHAYGCNICCFCLSWVWAIHTNLVRSDPTAPNTRCLTTIIRFDGKAAYGISYTSRHGEVHPGTRQSLCASDILRQAH